MFQILKRESPYQVPMSKEWRFVPFRSMNDFILDGTWSMPSFSHNDRFNNRIINNLIYYQTNYFLLGIAVILLVGIIFSTDFLYGLGAVIALFFARTFIFRSRRIGSTPFHRYPNQIKTGYLIVYIIVILGAIYMCLRLIYSIMILTYSILLAILAILIHAMLRKRNLANKVANKVDKISLHKTPMGIFLEVIGMHNV